jgi:uncharacterized RDD family membrane protein YckC
LGTVAAPFADQVLDPGVCSPHHLLGALPRRIAAFFIDVIILGVPGNIIGMLFFDYLSRIGSLGALFGFVLALPYFAFFNSEIGNGQTLGKRLLRLQVVDKDGNMIPFTSAIARYSIFTLPYCISDMTLPATRMPWFISILVYLVIYGVGGGTLYLVFFNRHTRQGLHDLAVGSYVADFGGTGALKISATWMAHWVIFPSLLVALVVGGQVVEHRVGPFPQLFADMRLLEETKGVQSAGVQDMTSSSNGERKRILIVNVRWAGESNDESAFADQIAEIILEHDPTVNQRDILRVNMIRGYNIGIATGQVLRPYEHSPAEWSNLLFGTDVPPTLINP